MAFNNFMHPRNPYKSSPPDFEKLGKESAEFRQYLKETRPGHWTVNFKDPEALRALTRALLEQDFGVKVSLPLDRLIPTVPLRLNYVLWIEDLLAHLPTRPQRATVHGFDIGTGASAIYPLLGAKLHGWHFFATEVDEASVDYAKQNVAQNGFDQLIKVQKVAPGTYLKAALKNEEKVQFDFCMCNPPFFTSMKTASKSRTDRRAQPNAICTGSESEMVTSGGEVEFVNGIIADSLLLKEQFSWYTTMLGKKASLSPVIASLRSHNVSTITTAEFCQGRVMRWGVAWSFVPGITVKESPTKYRKHQKKAKPLQFLVPDEFVTKQRRDGSQTKIQLVAVACLDMLRALKIDVEKVNDPQNCGMQGQMFQCVAVNKTWSNQRRERRKLKRQLEEKEQGCAEMGKKGKGESNNDERMSGEHNKDVNRNLGSNSAEERSHSPTASCTAIDETTGPQSGFLFSFTVHIGSCADGPEDSVMLEMKWVDGDNKNDLYQLFQYFQNKILKGL